MDTNRTRFAAASTTVFLVALFTITSMQPASAQKPDPDEAARVRAAYAGMPLRFEKASGTDADFIARGAGYTLDLTNAEARLAIGTKDGARANVTIRLPGSAAAAPGEGRRVLPGVTNYLIGSAPGQWRTGVRSYAEVAFRGVYPGVDVVYYGNQRRLEFDFIVSPGASHRAISLAFDGSTGLSIDREGNLLIETAAGTLVQRAPAIYQERAGSRSTVRGRYVLRRGGRVGFDVGSYDRTRPLVIDPVLTYSTYLGGSREERAEGLAFDAQGNMYIAGLTGAANFPATGTPGTIHGRDDWDVFVVKLNATGDQFVYATYIGGSGYEEPAGLAVDANGNAYVTGQTNSVDFPAISAIQSSRHGIDDAFVTKLGPSGTIVYSTYLGGNGEDAGTGIAVDALGRAYIGGSTISGDFPTVNPLQPSLGGSPAFRTTDGGHTWAGIGPGLLASSVRAFAIDPMNPQTVYAGSGADGVFKSTDGGSTWTATSSAIPALPVNAMAVASSGAVFVGNDAGLFRSRDGGASWRMVPLSMPVSALAFDPASHVLYAGAPAWFPAGVFTSADEGDTWSNTNLPQDVTSLSASQSVAYAGTSNGVFKYAGGGWTPASAGLQGPVTSVAVSSVNPDVAYAGTFTALYYTTNGGGSWSALLAFPTISVTIAASNPSVVYVATSFGAGMTEDGGMHWQGTGPAGTNLGFFAIDPLDPGRVYSGGTVGFDAFVSRVSADGSHLEYSTFIGGSSSEWGTDIAVDASGAAYVAGITQSTDFPVRNAFQPNAAGLMDVFAAKISGAGALVYSTYLGGSASDYAPKIAVDAAGQPHIVGITLSSNFPTRNAFQPSHGGGFYDVFVTTLNASGNGLVFSTYLGGNDQDGFWQSSGGPAVAVGPAGDTFVTGATVSRNFPTRDAIQPSKGGGNTSDAFLANFDASGQLVYSTYFGGTSADYATRVAVDPAGNVAIAGGTTSSDLRTQHPIQGSKDGAEDVFIARIASGSIPPDTVAPTTAIDVTGTPGSNGWFTSAVTVTLRAVDDEGGSGVAFIEYSLNGGAWQRYTNTFAVAAQGATTVRARATDGAGNVESPGASITLNIDGTGPAITISSPAAIDYLHTDVLLVSFGATDTVSGLASATATIDGAAVADGQTVSLLTLALGTHTFVVSASDQAGNTSSATITFRIVATIDSLISAVNTFVSTGDIGATATQSLLAKLNDAKQLLSSGDAVAAQQKLMDFKNHVSAQTGKSISPAAAQLLIADADFVIAAL